MNCARNCRTQNLRKGGADVQTPLLIMVCSEGSGLWHFRFCRKYLGMGTLTYIEFNEATQKSFFSSLSAGQHILEAVRKEVEGGWLFTVKDLISSEVFSDFMDMAEHLLEEGYKDAAAVVIGSVLEEHLRKLCDNNDISVRSEKDGRIIAKRADKLNHELVKAAVYNKLDMKQITSWLDLRNKAAHGEYGEYSFEQVGLLLQGVKDFVSRTSR